MIKEHMHQLLAQNCAMQFKVYATSTEVDSYISPQPHYRDNYGTGVNWAVRDVMVGTVRSTEQLQFCLNTKGYYAPERLLPDSVFPVRHIALLENGVSDLTGIRHHGAVERIYKVQRGRIPVPMRNRGNPDEIYYYFEVDQWELLPAPIAIRDSYKGKPEFTNRFLLEHCSGSYQLFSISSESQWRLMRALFEGLEFLSGFASNEVAEVNGILGVYSFTLLDGSLIIRNERGSCLYSSFLQPMLSHPRASFREICNALGIH